MTYTWGLAFSHTSRLHECMQYVEEKIAIQVLLKTEDKKRAVKKYELSGVCMVQFVRHNKTS